MLSYRNKEDTSIPEMYRDFTPVDCERLFLRDITDKEYSSVESLYKDKFRLFFTAPGIALIFFLLFFGGGVLHSLGTIAKHESDGWMMLFIFSMAGLLMCVTSYLAVIAKTDKFVSKNALVTAGIVVKISIIRGSRGGVAGAYHVIALPGSRQLVTIKDNPPIPEGCTVLIVRSQRKLYHVYAVPSWAADLDRAPEGYSYEIASAANIPGDDYLTYDKVSLSQTRPRRLSDYEYKEIPARYRTVSILGHGATSVCWVFFALLSIGLLLGAIHSFKTHNTEALIITLVGFFCSMIIDLIISPEIFRQQLPKGMTSCVECIPIKKSKIMGRCLISAVFPENRQYVDNIEVDPAQYDSIYENVPVKLYFSSNLNIIKYVSSV